MAFKQPAANAIVRDRILRAAGRMASDLADARAKFENTTHIGDEGERPFREFLSKYLTKRYTVAHGEVIDTDARQSGQLDVVVLNDSHPEFFSETTPDVFFIEGVSAVGEVKALLTSDELKRAIIRMSKFRELTSTSPPIGSTITISPKYRFFAKPPTFLFAYGSQVALATVRESLEQSTAFDFAAILGRGWIVNLPQGSEIYAMTNPDTGERLAGWHHWESPAPLFDLLLWLTTVMPTWSGGVSALFPYIMGLPKFPSPAPTLASTQGDTAQANRPAT